MIVIGIDPGSRITGYGLINQTDKNIHYITSGYIKTLVKDIPTRLKLIYSGISEIIIKFRPCLLAIEQVFISKNANSSIKLAKASGVAIVAAVNHNLDIFEYANKQVKQIVTGTGLAEKIHIQNTVRLLLNLSYIPQVDAADALAIAITHCYYNKKIHKKFIY